MEIWTQFLEELKSELGEEVVRKWVPRLARFDAGNLFFEIRDSFQMHWFEEHIRPRLKAKLYQNGRPIKVHFITQTSAESNKNIRTPQPPSYAPDFLDPDMDLAHFILSEETQVPFELLSSNDPPCNPIYIYGQSGTGKTHLLMGAGRKWQSKGKKVFYVRAETFTNHVIQAIRMGHMREFRNQYRNIDILILDDIHIFAKKTATQEEFFHTFNTLHTSGRLVVLSASYAPSKLVDIEPRLISRFEWGISLKLQPGPLRQILEKKAALWHLPLSEEILSFLLTHFPQNPISALQTLALRAHREPLTIPLVQHLLKDLLAKEQLQAPTPEKIIQKIASHYGIKSEDILGKSQTREHAIPRQMAMFLCRTLLKLPFQKIGEIFDKNHSTVMSSVKQIHKGIEEKTTTIPPDFQIY